MHIYLKYLNIRVRSDKRRGGGDRGMTKTLPLKSVLLTTRRIVTDLCYVLFIPEIITEVKVVLSCDEKSANSMLAFSISCSGSIRVTVCMNSG